MLANSKEGYALIDRTLYARFGMLIVIIPRLSAEELLISLASCKLLVNTNVLTDEARSLMVLLDFDELNEHQHAFVDAFFHVYTTLVELYKLTSSPEDDLCWMRELAENVSNAQGFSLEYRVATLLDVDGGNRLCHSSFYFLTIGFFLIASGYSANKTVNLDLYLDTNGAYCDFSFEIASKFSNRKLIFDSIRLKKLSDIVSMHQLVIYFTQENDILKMRAYPWVLEPDS